MTDAKKLLNKKLQQRLKQPKATPAAAAKTVRDEKLPPGWDASAAPDFSAKLEVLIQQHNEPALQAEEQQAAALSAPAKPKRSSLVRPKRVRVPRQPLDPERKRLLMRLVVFYGLAALIVLLDQFAKYLALDQLINGQQRIFVWLDLHLVYNPGAAFSMLANSSWQRPFLVVVSLSVSLVLVWWLPRTAANKLLLPLGLSCILGGAVGNLIDRTLYGYVVDFVSLHYQQLRFPTFNLADTAITLGALLLIVDLFLNREEKHPQNGGRMPSGQSKTATTSVSTQSSARLATQPAAPSAAQSAAQSDAVQSRSTKPVKPEDFTSVDDFIQHIDRHNQARQNS